MKFKMIPALIVAGFTLVGCNNPKPYNGYIRDNVGPITDVVLDVYRTNSATSGEYTVICVHLAKYGDSSKDVTLNLIDIKGIKGESAAVNPLSFCQGIGSFGSEEMHPYASLRSNTFTLAKDEHGAYPDCYICFDKGAIDKNSVIKIKDQEINHDANKPSQLDL